LYQPPNWNARWWRRQGDGDAQMQLGWLALRLSLPSPERSGALIEQAYQESRDLFTAHLKAELQFQAAVESMIRGAFAEARVMFNGILPLRPDPGLSVSVCAHRVLALALNEQSDEAALAAVHLRRQMEQVDHQDRHTGHLALALLRSLGGELRVEDPGVIVRQTEALWSAGRPRDLAWLVPFAMLTLTLLGRGDQVREMMSGSELDRVNRDVLDLTDALSDLETGRPRNPDLLTTSAVLVTPGDGCSAHWVRDLTRLTAHLGQPDRAVLMAADLWTTRPRPVLRHLFGRLSTLGGATGHLIGLLVPEHLSRDASPRPRSAAHTRVDVRLLRSEARMTRSPDGPAAETGKTRTFGPLERLLLARLEDGSAVQRSVLRDDLLSTEDQFSARDPLAAAVRRLGPLLCGEGTTRNHALRLAPGVEVLSDLTRLGEAARAGDLDLAADLIAPVPADAALSEWFVNRTVLLGRQLAQVLTRPAPGRENGAARATLQSVLGQWTDVQVSSGVGEEDLEENDVNPGHPPEEAG